MSETENFLAQDFNERELSRDPVEKSELSIAPTARTIGPVNWLGLWTLYVKEVRRFLKVYTQTIIAPAVTTLIFLSIFSLALGGAVRKVGEVPFLSLIHI